jgi:hypothetical protein
MAMTNPRYSELECQIEKTEKMLLMSDEDLLDEIKSLNFLNWQEYTYRDVMLEVDIIKEFLLLEQKAWAKNLQDYINLLANLPLEEFLQMSEDHDNLLEKLRRNFGEIGKREKKGFEKLIYDLTNKPRQASIGQVLKHEPKLKQKILEIHRKVLRERLKIFKKDLKETPELIGGEFNRSFFSIHYKL